MRKLLIGVVLLPFLIGCGHPVAVGLAALLSQPSGKKDKPVGPPSAELLEITTTTLLYAVNGVNYDQAVEATGGVPPYTWSISANNPPSPVTIDPATGVLSGTPSDAIGDYTFVVQVMDSTSVSVTQELIIALYDELQITFTPPLPDAANGVSYGPVTITVSGGTGNITWGITAGSRPSGLSFDRNSGQLSGTPNDPTGLYEFTVTVRDDAIPRQTDTINLTMNLYEPLVVTAASLPDGTAGAPYSAQVEVTGGSGDLTWSLSGAPSSLSINTSTGVISGTLASGDEAGSPYTLRVTATDNATGDSDSRDFTVVIFEGLQITTASLPDGAVGVAYTATVAATGGSGDVTWSLSGAPPSISIVPDTGLVSGTPVFGEEGVYTFSVSATDNVTGSSTSHDYPVQIELALHIRITTTSLPDSYVGAAYDETVSAVFGVTPYTWSWSGNTPSGLGLDSGTGVVSGTPDTVDDYTFTVTVLDSDAPTTNNNREFTIHVYEKLLVTTTTLPNGEEGMLYSKTLSATGGSGLPTWSVVSGSLPPGLDIDPSTGEIFGVLLTGTGGNTYDFRVRAVDGADSDEKDISVTVVVGSPPRGDFEATPAYGTVPLDVSFTDRSVGTVNSWGWDFDNDGTIDSSTQSPTHQYTAPGWYTVKLAVGGPEGSDTCTRDMYILAANSIRYADATVISSGDGTTWASAFQTIQEALDAAGDYDLIFVADGTYSGVGNKDLDFAGKAVYLNSVSDASSAVIDCESSGRGFYFHSAETNDAVIEGFTIRNAYVNDSPRHGGGICCDGATPTIKGCIIDNCQVFGEYSYGGAISCVNSISPLIQDCVMTNNALTGGINRYGGALYSYNSSPTIINCLIAGNTSSYAGGGCDFYYSSATLINTTIADNSATGPGYGGGVHIYEGSVTFDNCIIWGNTGSNGNQLSMRPLNTTVILNNSCYADAPGDVYNTITQANDCIHDDPLFVGAGDYHLQAGSPCLDVGGNFYLPAGVTTDLDGAARIVNGTVDLGAYEKP